MSFPFNEIISPEIYTPIWANSETMDLNQYSLPELRRLLVQVEKELARRQKARENGYLQKDFAALAAKSGQSLDKLLEEAAEQFARMTNSTK